MRDHEVKRITRFRGLHLNGEEEVCPLDFSLSCSNLEFTKRGFRTRIGSTLDYSIASVRRAAIFRIPGQAQRLLILNSVGELFDSTNLGVPILTIGAMTDFSVVVMYGRAYITPHDGKVGLPGEIVYVYTGAGTARPAAGTSPTGFTLTAANSPNSGKVEAGIHLIGVSYITNTGFITKPSGFVSITNIGARKLDISNIGTGPAYVVARVLVSTKIVASFNGDFINQTYYLIPGGQIDNNVSTTLTVDYYDADLVQDASFLLEQLEEIPAGVCITNYNSRLCVGGSDAEQSTVWISKKGDPESVDAAEGFLEVNPGDAGAGVRNMYTYRTQLIINKSQRTYYTVDNDQNAVFWKPDNLDASHGSECHGVGKILDFGETIEDKTIVATRSGLRLFNGTYATIPLTVNIDDLWSRINKKYFHTVEVAVDSEHSMIYVNAPIDGQTSPSVVLVGDFKEGLDSENIKWCPWSFPISAQTIVVDETFATEEPVLKIGAYTGNIYKMDPTATSDFGYAIDNFYQFALIPSDLAEDTEEGIYHFAGVILNINGAGDLLISGRNQNAASLFTATPITLSIVKGIDEARLFDFTGQKCSILIRMASINEYMIVSKFGLLTTWLWADHA